MHQFNEHHPELKGFSAYFFKEIAPLLSAREDDRTAAIATAKKYSLLAGAVLIAIFAIAVIFHAPTDVFPFVGVVGIGVIFSIYAWQLKSVSDFTKAKIVDGICHYVGWEFDSEPSEPNFNQWAELYLIPKGYDRASVHISKEAIYEDQISGQAHGADFQSVEVLLEKGTGDDNEIEFRGQLMSITFPRKFMGRTVVLRDKGFLQRKKKGDMKRVGLVDPVFEKLFEAYGTDQVEARYLLTPVFMQSLVDLENSVQGKNIRFGFSGNQLFIAVETKDRFEAGSMFEPLTSPARTQKILDEIGAVYDVVDVVSRSKRG